MPERALESIVGSSTFTIKNIDGATATDFQQLHWELGGQGDAGFKLFHPERNRKYTLPLFLRSKVKTSSL